MRKLSACEGPKRGLLEIARGLSGWEREIVLDFQQVKEYTETIIGEDIMGTKFRMCYKCFEYSRNRKGWDCPHCNPPRVNLLKVSSLGKPTPVVSGKRYVPEHVGYKQWLVDNRREANPKAWTDYCLKGYKL